MIVGSFVSVGAGGPSGQVNAIFMPLRLKPKAEREMTHMQLMDKLRPQLKEIKGLRANMRDISARNLSSGRSNPLALNIRGPDLKILNEKADELMKRLEDEKFAVDLDTDFRLGIPELLIEPKRDAMAERGVSVQAVGQALSAGVGGIRQGRFTSNSSRFDIRFKILDEQIKSVNDLKRIYVRNIAGNLIPLSQLVQVSEKASTQSISRINRQRSISIFGNLAPGQSQSIVLKKAEQILKEILPVGYSYGFEGASAGFASSFQSLTSALMIGILVAFLILAIQFNSFIQPISVLMALPFSVTGALIALWMFDKSLNLFSFIGLIVLMGIAKKNSILLVEFTNQVREKGMQNIQQALTEACPVRLRPILMTSIATVAAAMPLVIDSGMGAEARIPMGMTIVGGTIVSTILTLFVVPALYLILSRLEKNQDRTHQEIT